MAADYQVIRDSTNHVDKLLKHIKECGVTFRASNYEHTFIIKIYRFGCLETLNLKSLNVFKRKQ